MKAIMLILMVSILITIVECTSQSGKRHSVQPVTVDTVKMQMMTSSEFVAEMLKQPTYKYWEEIYDGKNHNSSQHEFSSVSYAGITIVHCDYWFETGDSTCSIGDYVMVTTQNFRARAYIISRLQDAKIVPSSVSDTSFMLSGPQYPAFLLTRDNN